MDRSTKNTANTRTRKPWINRRDTVDLTDLFGFYMSRLPLLIAAVLAGAVTALLITIFLIPDKYTATSRMYMVSASSDTVVNLSDLNIGTSLSKDYAELMQTRPIIEGMAQALELDYTYEDILKMLTLSVVPDTRIVKISVTSMDPHEAMAMANQMARTSRVMLPKVMEAPTPTIAELAALPTKRSSPSLPVNVMLGAMSFLLLTLVSLTVLYRMDDTIKTSDDLEKTLGVLPLSVIPESRSAESKPRAGRLDLREEAAEIIGTHQGKPERGDRAVFKTNPKLSYAMEEAINRLRINVSFFGADIHKIMVVSAEPDEGKSLVCMQLWRQMAMAQMPSILVDADMRKSCMVSNYGISREDGKKLWGLSHYLSDNKKIEDCILTTDMEYGDLLPNVNNVVNPSMLLESRRFSDLLDTLGGKYRYVFLDTPPLGLVSDGERIGHLCDGAILVIRGGVTPRSVILNSVQQLERAGCPMLGFVLNRVDAKGGKYYGRYYGKYYGKYYGGKYYSSEYYGEKK